MVWVIVPSRGVSVGLLSGDRGESHWTFQTYIRSPFTEHPVSARLAVRTRCDHVGEGRPDPIPRELTLKYIFTERGFAICWSKLEMDKDFILLKNTGRHITVLPQLGCWLLWWLFCIDLAGLSESQSTGKVSYRVWLLKVYPEETSIESVDSVGKICPPQDWGVGWGGDIQS